MHTVYLKVELPVAKTSSDESLVKFKAEALWLTFSINDVLLLEFILMEVVGTAAGTDCATFGDAAEVVMELSHF